MRRTGIVLGVVLLVLLALAAAADRVAAGMTARGIQQSLADGGVELDPDAEVRIQGFPFLTQLRAGRLQEVTATASSAVVDDLLLTDVDAVVREVATAEPYVAGEVEVTATVPPETIEEALTRSPLAERGLEVQVRLDGEDVVASTTFLGLPVQATLTPAPAGRAISLDVRSVSVAGLTVSTQDMPAALRAALSDLRIPLPTLPEGLEITGVEVRPDGLRLTAQGADLALGSLVP